MDERNSRVLLGAMKAGLLAAAITGMAGAPVLAGGGGGGGGGGGNDCNGCPNMGGKTAKATYFLIADGNDCSGNGCNGNGCNGGGGSGKATYIG